MTGRIGNLEDYRKLRSSFRWERPAYFNFAADVIDRHASERPDAAALHWVSAERERIHTFAELAQRSRQVASALHGLGLPRQSHILVVLPRVPEWWEALLGILRAGMVAIPGTSLLTSNDLLYRIRAGDAVAVITDANGAEKIDRITEPLPQVQAKITVDDNARPGWHKYDDLVHSAEPHEMEQTRPDDPALMYFTSGTTGMPKMVLHTQASYGIGHAITGRLWLGLQPGDLHWNISDTGWAKAAWSSFFGPWICGATVFAQHSASKFDPADVLRLLNAYPITSLCAAPTIYRMLVQQDLSSFRPARLRSCVAAGEPLNPEVLSVWQKATGLTIRDGYGQTETVLLCGNFPGIAIKAGSMGLPSPGFNLAVIDEEGRPLPAGAEGDVAVRIEPERPVALFREYYRNEQETAAMIRNGWYVTGDRALIDGDGYFWFVGRADDVINSSAYRIGPFEVESALIEHPAVAEAAVIGKPDPLRGQIVKAFIVLAEGYAGSDELKESLQEHVKNRTAPYKYPREIEFLAELPKTISGKIRRLELRKREEQGKS